MRKTHPTIAALAAVTIALAACEQRAADETGETEEEVAVDLETQLDDFRSNYQEAWNARDWDTILLQYTDDFQEVTPEGEVLGYGDLEGDLRDPAQAPPEDARLAIDTESMQIAESGDIAYATGSTTLTATGPDGQPITMEERWMAGFERVDGEWKLDRLVRTAAGAETPDAGEAAPAAEPGGGTMEEADTTAM